MVDGTLLNFGKRYEDNLHLPLLLISSISTMVNGTLLNFGKRYEDDLRFIFDWWPKLHVGLDALSNQKILNGVYLSTRELKDSYER